MNMEAETQIHHATKSVAHKISEAFKNSLNEALSMHLECEFPPESFLSCDIDSAPVAALAQPSMSSRRLRVFTVESPLSAL